MDSATTRSDTRSGSTTKPNPADEAIAHGATNVGAIDTFEVPTNWQLGRHTERAYGYVYSWHPDGNTRVSLNLIYLGRPLHITDSANFQDLLATENRPLALEELHPIRAVLSEKADIDVFRLTAASVKEVSDMKVLAVTGGYKDQPVDVHAIYINASGDGRVVQEVSFIAPRDLFQQFLPDAERALSTLRLR